MNFYNCPPFQVGARRSLALGSARRVKRQMGSARPFSRFVILGSLGLSICLFAWGLQYKLSLYDPAQATSHLVPQAKLLSRNEQPATTGGPLIIRTKTTTEISYTASTTVLISLLSLFSALSPRVANRWRERTSNPRCLDCGLFSLFLVRPPPLLF